EGRKLVIFLEKVELPEIPEVDYAGKRMLEILDDDSLRRRRLQLRKVAIDPGHGGIDNGKVSPSGIREKDVNLEIAFLLRDRLIETLGVEVVMTRVEDELIPLDHRAEMANSAEADLFISIHCNGWFHPDAGGFETFFLSPARTEEEARLASEENASLKFENPELRPEEIEDLDFILWDMVQNEFINESSDLAEMIQRELDEVLDIRNRGVKQAGLKVLKGLRMPAVLFEIAFLSNPQEEKLLQDPSFHWKVVQGIVEAIRRFQDRHAAVRNE
ncbi:MAG: N-acetylmuramoyl-L-alanine amidase, partial [Candidatus Krumholzibacteria bacterium]|nr:N-acetylmuramoyl-L-alanine amidase [Candidatus Krumholzibacteria bacterium]